MRIFKFLLLILLIAPINAFGACEYGADECNNHSDEGCYWRPEYEDLTAGLVPSSCELCLPGHYIEGYECKICPAGYYCTGDGQKTLCPAGTYNDKMNSVSDAACTPCPAGSYCENGIKKSCEAGTYSDSPGASSCTDCPAGTYSGEEGLTSSDECTPCPAGKYSAEGASSCNAECTEPTRPGGPIGGSSHEFEFTGGGSSATSCPWSFSCKYGKNIYPVCSQSNDIYNCSCQSCGKQYEVSNTKRVMRLVFNGSTVESDLTSEVVCPVFQPLELATQSSGTPERPSSNGSFRFYAIIKDDQVLLSSPANKNDRDKYTTDWIEIQNVALSNGVNYSVELSIGRCKFETSGCGGARNSTCQVKVGNCTAEQLRAAVGDRVSADLGQKWNIDIPVLIARAKMYFDDEYRDYELHIMYTDTTCHTWYKNTGEIKTWNNGTPILEGFNDTEINNSGNGYNKKLTSSVPFLGYTIGCWRKERPNGQDVLNSQYIMLEEDFEYPFDCDEQSALPEDPNNAYTASVQDRAWPGVSGSYTYANVDSAVSDATDFDKRCFIVGLYGYPPCSPGCYCPNGTSSSCGEGGVPFTSKRGSSARTDCHLKNDISFWEGGTNVTSTIKKKFSVDSFQGFYWKGETAQ